MLSVIRILRGSSRGYLKNWSSLLTLSRSKQKRLKWITQTGADWIIDVSLMLSLEELHDRQNHSFSNVGNSYERNFSNELLALSAMGTDTTSCFSFLTVEYNVIVVLKMLQSKPSVLIDVPFSSSRTTCRISATSC